MKHALLLLSVLALAACDKPKYEIALSCSDGAGGKYLIETAIYKTRTDMVVTRLSKVIRNKHEQPMADKLWLYNQLPNIGDTVKLSLAATKAFSDYTEQGHVKLDIGHDLLDGGLRFHLWHAADNFTRDNGEYAPTNGEFLFADECDPVIERKLPNYGDVAPEKLKEIQACAAYLEEQAHSDPAGFLVYDENNGKEMIVSDEQMDTLTNGVPLHYYFLYNMSSYPEYAVHACDIADKLRTHIKEHIDTAGQPIYTVDNIHCENADAPNTTKIEIYYRYAQVYTGAQTYRVYRTQWSFGKNPSTEYQNLGMGQKLVMHADSESNEISFIFNNNKCFFDENDGAQKYTHVVDSELIKQIFHH